MKTFPTVEDYIEVVAGAKDIVTGKQTTTWFFGFQPIISLARYDVDVLTSMFESATNNKALTEKQGALACKILLKYQRQLAAKLVDVAPLENPVWRVPLRKMDYTQSLALENEKLVLRFPYNTKMIEEMRSFKKESQGVAEFNYDAKVWSIALTEYNLSWCYAWSKAKNFTIEPEVELLYNKIEETEKTPYAIALECTEAGLDIPHCPSSLRSYIEEHLGGFGIDNITTLVDYSSVLGYTIDEFLSEALIREFGHRYLSLATNNELRILPESRTSDDDLASVLDYAESVGRFPIVIYEPDLSNKLLNRIVDRFSQDEMLVLVNQKLPEQIDPAVKIIHTVKPLNKMARIPYLISGAGMVFGGNVQTMIQAAEKIVYVAAEVYTKTKAKAKIKKI